MCWTTCLEPISNENIVVLTHAFSFSYFGSFCKKYPEQIMYKQTKMSKNNVFFHTETNIRKPYTSYAIVGCGGINPYSFCSGLSGSLKAWKWASMTVPDCIGQRFLVYLQTPGWFKKKADREWKRGIFFLGKFYIISTCCLNSNTCVR